MHVTNLDDLDAACRRLGLELVRGQTEYKWYGESVGDYPLPEGFTVDELGKCEHAIRIPGDETAYEIGVVRRRDGKPGYVLHWDFYMGGFGIEAKVGKDCGLLKQSYATAAASRVARSNGFRVAEKVMANGAIQLVCSK